MADDFSPIYAGDTGAPFAPQFTNLAGVPINLIGASITMKMQLVSAIGPIVDTVGTVIVCAGTWTIDDATNGKAHYGYTSADVASPGVWNMYITITIGGVPVHADTKQLVILPAP